MSSSQRYYRGRVVEIDDTLSDDIHGDDCPECEDNHDGFWSEPCGGRDGKAWKCHACGERWPR